MPGASDLLMGSETASYFTVAAWILNHEVTLIYEEPNSYVGMCPYGGVSFPYAGHNGCNRANATDDDKNYFQLFIYHAPVKIFALE